MVESSMKQNYRLGAKPPQAGLSLPRLPGPLAARIAPPKLDRSNVVFQPLLGMNNTYGDCTAAGLANAAEAKASLGGFSLGISDAQILAFYAECLRLPQNDLKALAAADGAYETDVLGFQAKHGFAVTNQVLVGAWASVADPKDLNAMRVLASEWGSAYLGVALAVADQNTDVWVANPPADAGDPTPGSWGGHCLILWDYEGIEEDSLVRLATWGGFQKATWGWMRKALLEAHGILWRQLGLADLQDAEYMGLLAEGRQVAVLAP